VVEIQDCRNITDHLRGIYGIYPNLIKENWRMSTCNRLDFQTLGSQPIIPKISSLSALQWYRIALNPELELHTKKLEYRIADKTIEHKIAD
jgi:hypothetical protein